MFKLFKRKRKINEGVISYGTKSRDKRFFVWVLIFFFVSLAFIGLIYVVIYSDFLKIKNFEIQESKLFKPEILKTSLALKMISDQKWLIWLGPNNILFWQFGEKPKTIKSGGIPTDISVNVDLFDKGIKITVAEKKLFGALCLPENKCYGFDQNGVILGTAPDIKGVLVLRIDDENNRAVAPGQFILGKENLVKNLFGVLEIVKKLGFIPAEVAIRNSSFEEWEITLSSSAKFYFSLNFMPENLAEILENIKRNLDLDKLSYIDFRVPKRIYYK